MSTLRKKFKSGTSLLKFIDKAGGVVVAASKLNVDRKTLYNFRAELGLI